MIYKTIIEKLNNTGISYTVVGMLGAIIQGMDITTMDIDIVVKKETDFAKIAEILKDMFFMPVNEAAYKCDYNKIIRAKKGEAMAFNDPYTGVCVDLLWEIDGFSHEKLFKISKTTDWEDIPVRVLDIEDIAKSKEIAGRAKDLAVLPRLREVISDLKSISTKEIETLKNNSESNTNDMSP